MSVSQSNIFGGRKLPYAGLILTDSLGCTNGQTLTVDQTPAVNHLTDASTLVAADFITGSITLSGTPGDKTCTLPTGSLLSAALTSPGAGTYFFCQIKNGSNGVVSFAGASGGGVFGDLVLPVSEIATLKFFFSSATTYDCSIKVSQSTSTTILLGTDSNARVITIGNTTGTSSNVINAGTLSTQINNGLQVTSKTPAAITADGTTALTVADSGGVFSITIGTNTTMAITLPTPAQGLNFKFVRLDSTAHACTVSDGSTHLYGNFLDTGAVTYCTVNQVNNQTTMSFVASGSIGDWMSFEGIDSTHYLVNGGCLLQNKMTIA